VTFPRIQIAQLLITAEAGATAQIRGAALEQAAVAMIGCVPGVFPPVTNVVDYATAGEIDILFPNLALRNGFWFLDRAFLCECKNWNVPVGAQEIRVFADRMRERNCRDGILISSHGITGDTVRLTAANHQVARALEDGREIIVLDWEDLLMIRSTRGLTGRVQQKWIQLKSFRTSVNQL
jgi:restriction endonuclease